MITLFRQTFKGVSAFVVASFFFVITGVFFIYRALMGIAFPGREPVEDIIYRVLQVPMTPFEIEQALRTQGYRSRLPALSTGPDNVYPALLRLEKRGLVERRHLIKILSEPEAAFRVATPTEEEEYKFDSQRAKHRFEYYRLASEVTA